MEKSLQEAVLEALREFSTSKRPVYLVGGAVRDRLRGRPAHDLDFVLPGPTRRLANDIACRFNGALYVMDEERDTTRVVLEPDNHSGERMLLDFASLRGADLESDLRARDFTINAMAMDAAAPDRLIDPTGGLQDLREKIIRACAPTSLSQDPVRILRAVRQALSFHFRIDAGTLQHMRDAVPLLAQPSVERLRDELFRILDGPQVSLALRILDQVGALAAILPELQILKNEESGPPHVFNAWEHTLHVIQHLEQLYLALVGEYREEAVTDLTIGSAVLWLGHYRQQFAEHFRRRLVPDRSLRALLFLAALYHDIGKPESRTVTPEGKVRFAEHDVRGAKIAALRGWQLALSAAEISRLETIIANHMRIHFLSKEVAVARGDADYLGDEAHRPSRRAIYRFFQDTSDAGVDICLLSLADMLGTYETTLPQDRWQAELQTCRALLEAYWEKSAEVVSPPRYLSGNDLMDEFGLKPGQTIGRLLSAIREAQAVGEINNREEALAFARSWLHQSAERQSAGQNSTEGKVSGERRDSDGNESD